MNVFMVIKGSVQLVRIPPIREDAEPGDRVRATNEKGELKTAIVVSRNPIKGWELCRPNQQQTFIRPQIYW